jgi:hypothetical protein
MEDTNDPYQAIQHMLITDMFALGDGNNMSTEARLLLQAGDYNGLIGIYYNQGCIHCARFGDTVRMLKDMADHIPGRKLQVIGLDATDPGNNSWLAREILASLNLEGTPEIIFVNKGKNTFRKHKGSREPETLIRELCKNTGLCSRDIMAAAAQTRYPVFGELLNNIVSAGGLDETTGGAVISSPADRWVSGVESSIHGGKKKRRSKSKSRSRSRGGDLDGGKKKRGSKSRSRSRSRSRGGDLDGGKKKRGSKRSKSRSRSRSRGGDLDGGKKKRGSKRSKSRSRSRSRGGDLDGGKKKRGSKRSKSRSRSRGGDLDGGKKKRRSRSRSRGGDLDGGKKKRGSKRSKSRSRSRKHGGYGMPGSGADIFEHINPVYPSIQPPLRGGQNLEVVPMFVQAVRGGKKKDQTLALEQLINGHVSAGKKRRGKKRSGKKRSQSVENSENSAFSESLAIESILGGKKKRRSKSGKRSRSRSRGGSDSSGGKKHRSRKGSKKRSKKRSSRKGGKCPFDLKK